MTAPTPWRRGSTLPAPETLPVTEPERRPHLPSAEHLTHLLPLGRIRQTWPYVVAALGNIAVFFMLFQTWLVTPNWSGFNAVDAFGTTHTTTTHINLWSQQQPPGTSVTGVWGILATISIFFSVFAAIQAVYRGTRITCLITVVSSVAVALFVIIDLFYIRSKQIPIQTMTGMGNDIGAHLGLVIMALRGTSAYPWPGVQYVLNAAHLTAWAWSTTAVAFASAGVATTRIWYSGLRDVAGAIGRNWSQRQARSVGQWLSDNASRARTTSSPQPESPTPATESTDPADDRDWGAAG